MNASPIISIRNARFGWAGGVQFSIDQFDAPSGRRIALIGASGGGKTTLLSLLAGVLRPSSGSVRVVDANLEQMSGPARDRFRGDELGIVFQMFNLLPYGTAIENVLLPLSFSSKKRMNAAQGGGGEAEAKRLLGALGLEPEEIGPRAVGALSVGQQQRVAAARALIGRPALILADEPTSALDPAATESFLSLLFAEASASGASVLCVTHDPQVAAQFDETVRIADILKTSGSE